MRHLDRAHRLAIVVALIASIVVLGPLGTDTALAQGGCALSFSQPTGSPFAVGAAPNAVASVDMNADGRPDLAVVNGSSGTVSILLSDASGGFTEATGSPITLGGSPSSVAVGNFNNDAFPDLAVGVPGPNVVAILLGNGNGSFNQNAGSIPLGIAPGGIVAGNFNNDGFNDLAVTGMFSSNLTILQGNGFGGFFTATGSPIAISAEPKSIVAGNFNGDGLADLAITHGGATNVVTILVGTGNFTFSQAAGSPINVGTNPSALAVGDFNADGRFDLAVTVAGSNSVAILLGNGNGTFAQAPGSPVAGISNPNGVVTGRFNDDTIEDLAVASSGSNSVILLIGNGSGGFTPSSGGALTVGTQPSALVAASFNGDPITDLAVVNQGSNNVSVIVSSCSLADLSVTIADSPDPVALGANLTYTIVAQNVGPGTASNVTLSVPTPPGATFAQITPPSGWTCAVPSVGQTGTVSCTTAGLAVGSANFTLTVQLGPTAQVGIPLQANATISSQTQDPTPANNSASATTTVSPAAGTCTPRPPVSVKVVRAGTNQLTVTLTESRNATTLSNQLNRVTLTIPANARVDVQGGASDLSSNQVITLPTGTLSMVFNVRRLSGTSVTIPLEIQDQCGTWKSFVGGGAGAF